MARLNHERVVLSASLHGKHVELTEVQAVGFTSPATWVGCCPHSCLCLGTWRESLVWGHSDERRASMPWSVEVRDDPFVLC
jgi:hypothetical protein